MSSSTATLAGLRLASISSDSSVASSARSGSTSSTPNSANTDTVGHVDDFFAMTARQTQTLPRQSHGTLHVSADGSTHADPQVLNAILASAPIEDDDIAIGMQVDRQGTAFTVAGPTHENALLPFGSHAGSPAQYTTDGVRRAIRPLPVAKAAHAHLDAATDSLCTRLSGPVHDLHLEQADGRDPMVFHVHTQRSSDSGPNYERPVGSYKTLLSNPAMRQNATSSRPDIQVLSPSPTPSPWQASFAALAPLTLPASRLRLDTTMPPRASSEPLSGVSASGTSKTMAFFNFEGASSDGEDGAPAETERRQSTMPPTSMSEIGGNAFEDEDLATSASNAMPGQPSSSSSSSPAGRTPYAPTLFALKTATEQRKRKLESSVIDDLDNDQAITSDYTPWITPEISSTMVGRYRRIANSDSTEQTKTSQARARGVSDPEGDWLSAAAPVQPDSGVPAHDAAPTEGGSSVALVSDNILLAEAARRPSRERDAGAQVSSGLPLETTGHQPSTLESLASSWWQQSGAQPPWLTAASPTNPAFRRATVAGNIRSPNDPYAVSELAGQCTFQGQPSMPPQAGSWDQRSHDTPEPASTSLSGAAGFEGRRRSRPTAIATSALSSEADHQSHGEPASFVGGVAPLSARRAFSASGSSGFSGSADYGIQFGAFLRSCEQNVGPPQLALEHYAPSSPATASFFAGAATIAPSVPIVAPSALPSGSTGRSTPALVAASSRSGGVSTPLSWEDRHDEADFQRQARLRASTHAGSYGYDVLSNTVDPGLWGDFDREALAVAHPASYDVPSRPARMESMPGTQNPFRSAANAQQARSGAYAMPAAINARQAHMYGQTEAPFPQRTSGALVRPLAGLQRAETYNSLRGSPAVSMAPGHGSPMPHSSSSPALLASTSTRAGTPPPSFAPSFETEEIVLRALPNSLAGDVLYPSRQELPNTALQPPSSDFDVEAHQQEESLPRNQSDKLRFRGDLYTPTWVRGTGNSREAWCDKCEEGGWMQLKNSQYWYHVRGTHGISPTSGLIFLPPLKLRCYADAVGTTEGLCHHCHKWIQICTAKRKRDFSGWFKHSAKCHPSTSGVRVSSDVPAPATIYANNATAASALQIPSQSYMEHSSSGTSQLPFMQQQEGVPLPQARRHHSYGLSASGMPASVSAEAYYRAPSPSGPRRQPDTTAADSVNYAEHSHFKDERTKRRRQ